MVCFAVVILGQATFGVGPGPAVLNHLVFGVDEKATLIGRRAGGHLGLHVPLGYVLAEAPAKTAVDRLYSSSSGDTVGAVHAAAPQWFPGGYSFARICRAFGVEHRLTKPADPWTNGQVERMNRTIKDATVQRYHYQTTAQLNEHLQALLLAYNHAKRLKRLRGLTPHEFVCAQWQMNPTIFTRDPIHLTLGLYTIGITTYSSQRIGH